MAEHFRRPAAPWLALAAVLFLLPCAAGAARAQEPAAEEAAAGDLRARVEERYEVLEVRDGLVLQPREVYRGVRSIEITDSGLAINGEPVSREEARGWLGERADVVLRLAELSEEARRALFADGEPPEEAAGARDEDEDRTEGEVEVEAEEAPELPEPPEGPEPPEVPEEPRRPRVRRGSQTVVGSTVRIEADEVADDVVVFGGSAVIDGRVEGNVTVFGGVVDVEGEVTRDVTAIGGHVRLGEDAEVGGDATAVGGTVDREPGARVRGNIEEVSDGWGHGWSLPVWGWNWWDWDGPRWAPWNWVWGMAWPVAQVLFLALLMFLVVAIGRDTVERVGTRAGAQPVKAGVVGLLVAILTLPVLIIVCVLLAISIIGIPILIVLLLLFVFVGIPGLLVVALVGYTGVAWRLGRWAEARFGWRLESPYMAVLAGLLCLYGLELVGQALDFGPVRIFAIMFLVVAAILQFLAGCVGFGAFFLLLYERWARRRAAGTLAPPPPPPPPAAS